MTEALEINARLQYGYMSQSHYTSEHPYRVLCAAFGSRLLSLGSEPQREVIQGVVKGTSRFGIFIIFNPFAKC